MRGNEIEVGNKLELRKNTNLQGFSDFVSIFFCHFFFFRPKPHFRTRFTLIGVFVTNITSKPQFSNVLHIGDQLLEVDQRDNNNNNNNNVSE